MARTKPSLLLGEFCRGAERPDTSVRLHRWTRLSSKKWEDAWSERLRFLGPSNVVFVTWPNSNALKVEAYCHQRQASELVSRFGGRASKLQKQIWTGDPARPRAPLSIRGKLKVFSELHAWRTWKQSGSKVRGIFIPAGMAFGTGEHTTTATCLRLLADVAGTLPANFAALDLGTGAGILAIAAKALGAGRVAAVDFDRVAVRIAKQNASTNGFSTIEISQRRRATARRPQTFRCCLSEPLQRRPGPSSAAHCPGNTTWRVADFLRCPPRSSTASRRGFPGRGLRKPPHCPPRKMVRRSVPKKAHPYLFIRAAELILGRPKNLC